jgi:hypothetical protein
MFITRPKKIGTCLDRIPIKAAETLLNADDRPWEPKSDLRQARAHANPVGTSEPSIEAFITYGFEEAMALSKGIARSYWRWRGP